MNNVKIEKIGSKLVKINKSKSKVELRKNGVGVWSLKIVGVSNLKNINDVLEVGMDILKINNIR